MRFILGIALIYGFVAQFATSGSHFRLFDTRKTIIFMGRAPSGCVESACNNSILCISQFHLRPAPPPPGYCGAFTRLVSPGGGAFANFALPGGRALANPRAIPELLTRTRFPIRI